MVDRESLKAFVLEAREYLDSFETLSGYRDALESFRAGGDWKQGSVYLYAGTTDGVVVFHAADPDLEGRNLYDLEDSDGVKIMQEILAAAAEGGGYVEYLWDDPAVAGDEETGSPKVGYAVPYTALGEEFNPRLRFLSGISFNGGSGAVLGAAQSWLCVILRSLRSALKSPARLVPAARLRSIWRRRLISSCWFPGGTYGQMGRR